MQKNLKYYLKDHIKAKSIACINAAKRLIEIEDDERILVLCAVDGCPSDVVLIAGSEDASRKKLNTLTLEKSWSTADIE